VVRCRRPRRHRSGLGLVPPPAVECVFVLGPAADDARVRGRRGHRAGAARAPLVRTLRSFDPGGPCRGNGHLLEDDGGPNAVHGAAARRHRPAAGPCAPHAASKRSLPVGVGDRLVCAGETIGDVRPRNLGRDRRPRRGTCAQAPGSCGGQRRARFGAFGARPTTSVIAMPSPGSAATVRCGRHSVQSRQSPVVAQLAAWAQRENAVPGQAWTCPAPTCQPALGANRAGSRPRDAWELQPAAASAAARSATRTNRVRAGRLVGPVTSRDGRRARGRA